MMCNDTLLEAGITHIRDHPELHNQRHFFEQTDLGIAACYAGRLCLLAGLQPMFWGDVGATIVLSSGFLESAWNAARDVAGLDDAWASNLFTPLNTRQMLDLKVKDLLNGAPINFYPELLK